LPHIRWDENRKRRVSATAPGIARDGRELRHRCANRRRVDSAS